MEGKLEKRIVDYLFPKLERELPAWIMKCSNCGKKIVVPQTLVNLHIREVKRICNENCPCGRGNTHPLLVKYILR